VPCPLQFSKDIQESYLISITEPFLQEEMIDFLLLLPECWKLDNDRGRGTKGMFCFLYPAQRTGVLKELNVCMFSKKMKIVTTCNNFQTMFLTPRLSY
jgi:hypothetical protein